MLLHTTSLLAQLVRGAQENNAYILKKVEHRNQTATPVGPWRVWAGRILLDSTSILVYIRKEETITPIKENTDATDAAHHMKEAKTKQDQRTRNKSDLKSFVLLLKDNEPP